MAAPAFLDEITLDELEADPYPIYARLRREAPVAWIPAADVWFVTRFDDCAAVGNGEGGFVGASDHPTLQRVFGAPNVLTADGDEHADLRKGIDPSLTPNAVNDMIDGLVRPVARHYLDLIRTNGAGELMADYFEPVSVESLRRVMGLDDLVDSATLRRWFHDLNVGVSNFGLDPDGFAVADAVSAEIEAVVRPRLEHLRAHPDHSMLSHMLWAGREGREPRPVELIMPSLKVILLGGMQEPGHAAGSTLMGLFGEPEQWARLVADPDEYIPLAVHEGMRWIAPIGAVERQASVDVELGGQRIPAGATVQVVLASANRDEARFVDPDRFDMERLTRASQSFGNGDHFCAGHFFARQVQRIMFEELVPALPGLRPDPELSPTVTGWVFRAPKQLPVRWDVHDALEVAELEPERRAGDTVELTVAAMRWEADDVLSLELVDPQSRPLPAWEPGAHVDLWVTRERASQYSLSSDPADSGRYRVAVLREPASRGTSAFVHEQLRPGARIRVGTPRNTFALGTAPRYVFIAGGIGITPILPMARVALAAGAAVEVLYCGRRRSGMAFLGELAEFGDRAGTFVGDEGERLDLESVVRAAAADGASVYACGPERMMTALTALAEEHDVDLVVERFSGGEAHREGDREFEIVLERTGTSVTVPADGTALEALASCGISILNACREGNCGSCETRVLAGAVDHRDVVLTKGQRAANDRMMVCVSRAAGERLTLDV